MSMKNDAFANYVKARLTGETPRREVVIVLVQEYLGISPEDAVKFVDECEDVPPNEEVARQFSLRPEHPLVQWIIDDISAEIGRGKYLRHATQGDGD